MAYFKISLLTLQFENKQSFFLEDVISEFNTQLDVYNNKKTDGWLSTNEDLLITSNNNRILYTDNTSLEKQKTSFCYSYGEQLSLSQNAQKTLSFSLDKFIIKENLREENPFARNIIIGSQILLIDQYNNNYFFTVTEISYDIKEINITYKVSCQDTFSYQASRQNNGYSIDNDETTSDFIGAKTIDWWVINKIKPECHIGYDYLSMKQGLYEDLNGSYRTFKYGEPLSGVKRIIKDAYSPAVYEEKNGKQILIANNDNDLFQTIPFNCSGSNANAALIELGETLDLDLKVFEHIDKKQPMTYFWFEPKKNMNRVGGLVYSPYNSIQSFGLSHKGDSLTTILNVTGPEYNNEIITLIPNLTPYFSNFFNESSWNNIGNHQYQPGMFLNQCMPQKYVLNNDNEYSEIIDNNLLYYTVPLINVHSEGSWEDAAFYDTNTGFLYIKLFQDQDHQKPLKINSLFTFVDFSHEEISELTLTIDDNTYSFDSNKTIWHLAFIQGNNELYDIRNNESYKDYLDNILTQINTIYPCFKIFIGKNYHYLTSKKFKPNFNLYREVSQEDWEFAKAAEECPWLENKLMDFSYFLENKLITEQEYKELMHQLTDDLRVVNGKLMIYATAYYQALHNRTKLMADLTNQLDNLGAAANADVVTTLRTKNAITDYTDYASFDNAYRDTLLTEVTKKEALLNYNDILSDYFNKFFSADQRFLKNIKNFRDYFESVPSTWLDPATAFYTYSFTITLEDLPPEEEYYINAPIDKNNCLSVPSLITANDYIQVGDYEGTPFYDIYDTEGYNDSNTYVITNITNRTEIVTANNYKNYYIRNPISDSDGKVFVKNGDLYNDQWIYYDSNDQEINDSVLKNDILKGIPKVYYRDMSFVSILIRDANDTITSIQELFKKDNYNDSYKDEFPVDKVYIVPSNETEELVLYFVNENTDENFLKLKHKRKWKRDVKKIKFDVYANRKDKSKEVDQDFIYCSTITPKDPYKNDTLKDTMGISFTAAEQKEFYFKEESFFRAVYANDIYDCNKEYLAIELDDADYDTNKMIEFFDRSSSDEALNRSVIKYWPIVEHMEQINFIGDQSYSSLKNKKIQDVITNYAQQVDTNNPYVWEPISGGKCPFTSNFIIIEKTSYHLSPYTGDGTGPASFYDASYTYCLLSTLSPIDYNQYEIRVNEDMYYKVKPYIRPDVFKIQDQLYYKQESKTKYNRVYTIKQLDEKYVYMKPKSINFSYLTPYETKITIPLLKIIKTYDKDNRIINFKKETISDNTFYFTKNDTHTEPLDYYKIINDVEVQASINDLINEENHVSIHQNLRSASMDCTLTKTWDKDIKSTNNGMLWYQCTEGDLKDYPSAVNLAATIEAQLEEYWQQAYSASLYCRYFLPESWRINYNTTHNYFNEDLMQIIKDSNNNLINVLLKDKYIPRVNIYSKNGETILPRYYIKRGFKQSYDTYEDIVDIDPSINNANFAINPIVKEAIEYFGESTDDFSAEEAGTTTYYCLANGSDGCTWSKFMTNSIDARYSKYSGLYDLTYRLIQKNYEPLELTDYENCKKRRQEIWKTLYKTYGYMMLENVYKDDKATTSAELLILAKYAFKDYTAPERQYNITVIDMTSLKGYKGEEIRIGDGIKIDAQAYYNEYDQIFKSLSQYLFVTDINYTLRSPTDISLTVNAIKYQDKLIQRLAKLIK